MLKMLALVLVMTDAFDYLGDAVTTDKGSILDYEASPGEVLAAGFERQFNANPLALIGRQARYFYEDRAQVDRVDQKSAQVEVARRGLDLKIPVGGMSRVELDMLQYLRQREISQNITLARAHSDAAARREAYRAMTCDGGRGNLCR